MSRKINLNSLSALILLLFWGEERELARSFCLCRAVGEAGCWGDGWVFVNCPLLSILSTSGLASTLILDQTWSCIDHHCQLCVSWASVMLTNTFEQLL